MLALDGTGNLFVADATMARVIDVTSGAVTTVVGAPNSAGVVLGPLPASLASPTALAWGGIGDLIISDGREPAILVARFR